MGNKPGTGVWVCRAVIMDFCRASQEGRKRLRKRMWKPDSDFLMENSEGCSGLLGGRRVLQICQESWRKHVAESKNKRSIPAVSTLCEQLCISYEQSHSYPRPSVSWRGQRGFIPDTSMGKTGRRNEALGGCSLKVVGGWRRDGWMWPCGKLFPCSA